MNDFIPFAVGTIVIIFAWWFDTIRSRSIIEKWAAQNEFKVLKCKQAFFDTGPFSWWTSGKGQKIYRFTVITPQGSERSGWIRCGSFWGGIYFSNNIEIRWEEK